MVFTHTEHSEYIGVGRWAFDASGRCVRWRTTERDKDERRLNCFHTRKVKQIHGCWALGVECL